MAKTLMAVVLVPMLCAFGAAQARADLITNGGFTPLQTGGPGFTTLYAPSTAIPGWSVTASSVDWVGTYWQAPVAGQGSIDLDGSSVGGAISQTFGTSVGATYKVTFDLSGNPDGGPTVKLLTVSAASNSQNYTYTLSASNSEGNMLYRAESFVFTATGTSTTLTFASGDAAVGGTYYGPVVGNVSAAAVPLPSAFLLFGPGLAGLAAIRRRFKK